MNSLKKKELTILNPDILTIMIYMSKDRLLIISEIKGILSKNKDLFSIS